ncbi:MAG: hypothetical protein BWK78_00540 [Thiotrichaceae bacterium IS1]|nr:MAG: hypothetical protein BWK78_00540 [Thiotrichaceae bacterium IS1]
MNNICPTCKNTSYHLLNWEFSGLDDSIFNQIAELYECPFCGLIYNRNITDEKLSSFYQNECSYSEKSHFSISSLKNIEKYSVYRKFIVDAEIDDQTIIADIGCGRGGFVTFLNKTGWNANCVGVDIDFKSLPNTPSKVQDESKYKILFREGKAVELPFPNNSQELLTYFHVLEHIVGIDIVLQEAHRVLKDTGHILIEVPDAERYKEYPIGSAFWLSIREHVYHFSVCSLIKAINSNGFKLVKISRSLLPTPEFYYPSLMILAEKNDKNTECNSIVNCSLHGFSQFVLDSYESLKTQSEQILTFNNNYSKLTFWGCSSELFSLLPLLGCKDFALCDSSKVKQKSYYKGIPILDPEKIPTIGILIIAPYLHGDAIEKVAIGMGWNKENIFRLT